MEDTGFLGRSLRDRYLVTARLGVGGMAEVFLAEDQRLSRRVVVKVPRVAKLSDPSFRSRFLQEVRTLTELTHPHIVRVLDAGSEGDVPFVVIEYLEGGTLQDVLESGGTQTAEEVAHWLRPVAEALDYIHGQGVLHRDVKPGNILFSAGEEAFLADFGLVKLTDPEQEDLTRTGEAAGSPGYIPPEIVRRDFRPVYDQFSLACVAFRALVGEPPKPFDAESEARTVLGPVVGPAISGVLARALSTAPDDRFASCSDFFRAFTTGSPDTGTRTYVPAPVTAPPDRPRFAHRRLVGIAAAVLLAVLCGLAVLTNGPRADRPVVTGTAVGETFLGGVLVVEDLSLPPGGDGKVEFVVRNVGTGPVLDHRAGILLDGRRGEDVEFEVYPGRRVAFSADASSVRDCRLEFDAPAPTRARDGPEAGTLLLSGALECVGVALNLSSPVFSESPYSMDFKVENRTDRLLEDLEFRVSFRREDRIVSATSWAAVGSVAPGKRRTLHADLSEPDFKGSKSILAIRRVLPSPFSVRSPGTGGAGESLRSGDRVEGPTEITGPDGSTFALLEDTVVWLVPRGREVGISLTRGTIRARLRGDARLLVPLGSVESLSQDGSEVLVTVPEGQRTSIRALRGDVRLERGRLAASLTRRQGIDVWDSILDGHCEERVRADEHSFPSVPVTYAPTAELTVGMEVPGGTEVSFRDGPKAQQVRVGREAGSDPENRVHIWSRAGEGARVAHGVLGPGTFALIDKYTGTR